MVLPSTSKHHEHIIVSGGHPTAHLNRLTVYILVSSQPIRTPADTVGSNTGRCISTGLLWHRHRAVASQTQGRCISKWMHNGCTARTGRGTGRVEDGAWLSAYMVSQVSQGANGCTCTSPTPTSTRGGEQVPSCPQTGRGPEKRMLCENCWVVHLRAMTVLHISLCPNL